jgi:hypothetical protein
MDQAHITLRLPADLAKSLAHWARGRRLPRSQVVREAIAQYLGGGPRTGSLRLVTAQDLAARWPNLPRLTPEEANDLSADIASSRAALPQPHTPWE